MVEQWKEVIGYCGLYEISNLGNAKRISKTITNCKGVKVFIKGRFKKVIVDKNNYHWFSLSINGINKTLSVHRLVAIHFVPNPENKPDINHKDGNKANNKFNNLVWSTKSENSKHAYETGLNWSYCGEQSELSKLTEKDVLEIRKNYIPVVNSYSMLAKKYNVGPNTIGDIICRRTWKHI